MIDNVTHEVIGRLASSRIVGLEKSLKTEVGNITADLADRGFAQSTLRVTSTKSAAERNLALRAELIADTIKEVCESRNIERARNLGADLQGLFDEIYQLHVSSVCDFIERTVPSEVKKLCPIGEICPEINMYRDDLALFAERLSPTDYWAKTVAWFRSRWWSVPFLVVFVCLPLLVKWVEMLKAVLQWLGATN
jgi:hypothetical protein